MIELIKAASLAEIEQDFVARAHKAIWCSMSTVDAQGRPRSRIIHPLWEGGTGWITTRRQSPKTKHLAHTPYISLAYIADITNPAYADCRVEWIDDLAQRQSIWDWIAQTPPPLGFDPTPMYGSIDDPGFGLLKLIPWRIQLDSLPTNRRVWEESH
jgi:general stress protein 26